MHYYLKTWKNIFNFSGISSRKEFWYATLLNAIAYTLILLVYFINGNVYAITTVLYFVTTLLPFTALLIRRLHDTDRSGYNAFWLFLPFAGWIILFIYIIEPSKYNYTDK